MNEVPKIVYDRLRAAQRAGRAGAHPETDLLAGFAEHRLSVAERSGVLEHLALCEDCREVVSLALPADVVASTVASDSLARSEAPIASRPRRGWFGSGTFTWPSLRWGALAAGVAMAASILLIYPERLNRTTERPQEQPVAVTMPASSPDISSPSQHQSEISKAPGTEQVAAVQLQSPGERRGGDARRVAKARRGETAANSELTTNNKKKSEDSEVAQASKPGNDEFAITGASSAVLPAPAPEGTLMARADAFAIEKAKPAPQEVAGGVIAQQDAVTSTQVPPPTSLTRNRIAAMKMTPLPNTVLGQSVTWAVVGGVLQRSVDGGQTWQDSLHGDNALLCYATRGLNVWAGGKLGTLFHSTDGGLTWVREQPVANGQRLNGDVNHLELQVMDQSGSDSNVADARNTRVLPVIVVSTGSNETWSSTDDGATWTKK